MSFQNLLLEVKGPIAFVTVNRPKALNALNSETIEELGLCFESLLDRHELRGVILKGGGEKAFVAGADITEFRGLSASDGTELSRKGQRVFELIENFPKPVIAMIQGFALGGGCELAMACHMRVASTRAIFGQPEAKLGLIPGFGGSQRLIQLLGKTRAIEWLMTGEMYPASELDRLGLLNRLVEPEELESAAVELMNKVLAMAPLAIARIVKTTAAHFNQEMDGYLTERQEFGLCFETHDFEEGVSAFLEKRDAEFKGI